MIKVPALLLRQILQDRFRIWIYLSAGMIYIAIFSIIWYLEISHQYRSATFIYVPSIKTVTIHDFETDASVMKYVDNKIHFYNMSYTPEDLSPIASDFVYDTKQSQQLRKDANIMLQWMAGNFYDVFKEKIVVVSAYRSYEYQQGIKDRGCPDNLCAKAGYSEHQTGLAVDVWEATTNEQFLSQPKLAAYYDWLKSHAHLYGFTNTYQK